MFGLEVGVGEEGAALGGEGVGEGGLRKGGWEWSEKGMRKGRGWGEWVDE